MFGRWLTPWTSVEPRDADPLAEVVRRTLVSADEESVQVVTAIAGLLGAIAYADRDYSEQEAHRVEEELGRVAGMTPEGVRAISGVLREQALRLSTVEAPRYSRVLRELGDVELRVQLLGVLVTIAAADGAITTSETNLLRHTASALGLTQNDYNAAQSEYRERLAVLAKA